MQWKHATEKMPPAGKEVRMRWKSGVTEWLGDIVKELAELKPEFYHTLLWLDNSTDEFEILQKAFQEQGQEKDKLFLECEGLRQSLPTVSEDAEGAAKEYANHNGFKVHDDDDGESGASNSWIKQAFKAGASWQSQLGREDELWEEALKFHSTNLLSWNESVAQLKQKYHITKNR